MERPPRAGVPSDDQTPRDPTAPWGSNPAHRPKVFLNPDSSEPTPFGGGASHRRRRIAVVGGGLAGLAATVELHESGVADVVLFEARGRLGGRLLSGLPTDVARGGFDLGATWFWPALQPQLASLVERLGLCAFAQHEEGDLLIERSATLPPLRTAGMPASPAGLRVAGGMAALVHALAQRLPASAVRLGAAVQSLGLCAEGVELTVAAGSGAAARHVSDCVVLALPPRLAAACLRFDPPLPAELQRAWGRTPTWMAPHAKYVAAHAQPFWRDRGLSGAARSSVGPLVEIHDASDPLAGAALFGFVGVPASVRARLRPGELQQQCRAQLARLFGPAAAQPARDWLQDWAAEAWTATDADRDAPADHAPAPPSVAAAGPWQGRLVGVASEWSPHFPGYVAGAIDAARRGVAMLLDASASPQP